MDLSLPSPKQILKKHALDYAKTISRVGHDFMYFILMAQFEIEGQHFNTFFNEETQTIELILRAMEQEEIRSDHPPKQLLDTFASSVIGAIVTWKFNNGGFNIVDKVDAIFETVYR